MCNNYNVLLIINNRKREQHTEEKGDCSLPEEAKTGPIARAKAPRLRRIPITVPF